MPPISITLPFFRLYATFAMITFFLPPAATMMLAICFATIRYFSLPITLLLPPILISPCLIFARRYGFALMFFSPLFFSLLCRLLFIAYAKRLILRCRHADASRCCLLRRCRHCHAIFDVMPLC